MASHAPPASTLHEFAGPDLELRRRERALAVRRAFCESRLVLVRNFVPARDLPAKPEALPGALLRAGNDALTASIRETFTLESSAAHPSSRAAKSRKRARAPSLTPEAVYLPEPPRDESFYSSFIVQGESALDKGLELLFGPRIPPVPGFLATPHAQTEACVWVFLGRNVRRNRAELPGRSEHTDAVVHDGTWHIQLQGSKRWRVRVAAHKDPAVIEFTCNPGDSPAHLDSRVDAPNRAPVHRARLCEYESCTGLSPGWTADAGGALAALFLNSGRHDEYRCGLCATLSRGGDRAAR